MWRENPFEQKNTGKNSDGSRPACGDGRDERFTDDCNLINPNDPPIFDPRLLGGLKFRIKVIKSTPKMQRFSWFPDKN